MNDIMKCARGPMQREFVARLARGEAVHSLAYGLRGRAAAYSLRYEHSTDNLVARIRATGATVECQLGPKGGRNSRTYRLVTA